MKNDNSKKRKGRIKIIIFWIICIALIVWMLSLSKNKEKTSEQITNTGNGNNSSVTELEKLAVSNYVSMLDFAEISILKDENAFNYSSQKLIFAQMEYLKNNPGAENDKEQIKSIYNRYFLPLSEEEFYDMYEMESSLAMDNRVENSKGVTNLEGNEILGGLSLYVLVNNIEKQQDGSFLVTVVNVTQLNLSKMESDNLILANQEDIENTYINYINPNNVGEYIYGSKEYQIKLAVDNGRIYIQEF